MRMPDSMSENMPKECHLARITRRKSFVPKVWGPARTIAIIHNGNDIKHLILDFLFQFFLRFGSGDAFCTDTFLQTDDVTHGNLYTEQFLRADILTQRGLCTNNFCTQAPLHTKVFTQRRKDAMYKHAFAHINKGT